MNRPDGPFLTSSAPVPIDRPFTTSWARHHAVDPRRLRAWVRSGLLVAPIHGVLYAAQLTDSLQLRIDCLRLVVPADAVVTDRTAAWLHGAPMVLEPNAHLQVPRVDLFLLPGGRIRRGLARSGQRELLGGEIEEIAGIRVTTRLRTVCDLGMKLPRRHAFAAMCMLQKVADFSVDDIRQQADVRFRGHRWVRQLRSLIPLCDPRFESPGECVLALTWHDTPGLPTFEPQFWVEGPDGFFRLDLAVPGLLYAAVRQWAFCCSAATRTLDLDQEATVESGTLLFSTALTVVSQLHDPYFTVAPAVRRDSRGSSRFKNATARRGQNVPSITRVAAGEFAFLTLSQTFDGPDL